MLDLSTRSRDLVGLVATTGVPVWATPSPPERPRLLGR
jgi:hypothetical protein